MLLYFALVEIGLKVQGVHFDFLAWFSLNLKKKMTALIVKSTRFVELFVVCFVCLCFFFFSRDTGDSCIKNRGVRLIWPVPISSQLIGPMVGFKSNFP